MKPLLIIIALAVPATAKATGMYQCEAVPTENWLTEAQLTEHITAEGWTVHRMKKDGGCWEVYGSTPEGQRVEACFHPETGDVKLINQRGTILFRAED